MNHSDYAKELTKEYNSVIQTALETIEYAAAEGRDEISFKSLSQETENRLADALEGEGYNLLDSSVPGELDVSWKS